MEQDLIVTELNKLGMPSRLCGYKYVVTLLTLLDKPEWKDPKWNYLYHCVGKMYNTSGSLVEAAIRYAFKTTRTNGDFSEIENVIGFSNCENSSSLINLYNHLKSKEKKTVSIITKSMIKDVLLDILSQGIPSR